MKLICAEYNGEGEMTVGVIGDNALLRNNADFYFPAFTEQLSCVPQLVVRACKLGKGISERFAGRYYEEVGVGIRFYADTLENELKRKGLPSGLAAAYDDSAALSGLQTYSAGIGYAMKVNGNTVFSGGENDLPVNIDQVIARSSAFHMIKIGDFFFCGNPFRYKGLKIGDHLQMYIDNEIKLDFYVR